MIEACAIPARQRTVRLPPNPLPRELDTNRLQTGVPGAADALFMPLIAALVQSRRKSEEPAKLAPVTKFPPDEPFIQ